MDPLTVFVIATLMMLLNGGVLGLIHRDLPTELQASAISWRVGTLLQAGGCILLAVQAHLPAGFILPLANGLLMLGITGYWRALRQFFGRRDHLAMLLPMLLGTVGIWWFAGVQPDLSARVWIASISWTILLVGCARELLRSGRSDPSRSRVVLGAICIAVALFMVCRGVYFALAPDPGSSVLDFGQLINAITPLLVTVLPVIGTTTFLLLCSDRIRRQWEHAASTDYLTGLANRRTLARKGAEYLQQARSEGSNLAVAVIDIDHFKRINDELGHDVGDQALQHVARQLVDGLADAGLPSRQGGEEFALLLKDNNAEQALARCQALCARLRQHPFQPAAGPARCITVSIGLALLHAQDRNLDDVLRRADQALYRAKSNGRDRVELA